MEAAVASEALEIAWTEGYIAGHSAQAVETNPYPADATMSHMWTKGWRAGRADRQHERSSRRDP